MNDLITKVVMSMAAAVLGGAMTYSMKAISIEGRLDGIERAVIRIENKLLNDK